MTRVLISSIIRDRLNPSRRLQLDIQRMYFYRNHGFRIAAKILHNLIIYRYACCVALHSSIDATVVFPHPVGIVIGEGVSVGRHSTIYQNVTLGQKSRSIAKYPIINEDCVIYAGASVLGDTTLLANTVVGAGSIVIDMNPSENTTLVGAPARVVDTKDE